MTIGHLAETKNQQLIVNFQQPTSPPTYIDIRVPTFLPLTISIMAFSRFPLAMKVGIFFAADSFAIFSFDPIPPRPSASPFSRSEERRVGKEFSCLFWLY